MTCNMGTADRTIRVILGIVIVAVGIYLGSWWGLIGLIPLITSALKWCPLYVPFKISTASKKDQ